MFEPLAAFLAALAAHTAVLHWIWIVTVVYGHAHPLLGVAGPLGLGAYIAAFTATFGAVAAGFARVGWGSPLLLAVAWTVLDHLRSFALSGFPWATLGYAQHLNPALLGLAPWTGVYGLSFATALGGFALARAGVEWRASGRLSRQTRVAFVGDREKLDRLFGKSDAIAQAVKDFAAFRSALERFRPEFEAHIARNTRTAIPVTADA